MTPSPTAVLGTVALTMGGCAITPENAYPDATSVQGCYNFAVLEQQNRINSAGAAVDTSNSATIAGSLVGVVLGTAAGHDANRTRLEQCVARFGATPGDIDAITAERRAGVTGGTRLAPASVGCVPGAGVLQRGSAYCVGY